MLVVCTSVSASSAATPPWYPQLRLAVLDTGDAGEAIAACMVPRAATPKAGHVCALVGASDESGKLDRVAVFAETGLIVGPCKRLLIQLDRTTTAAADRTTASSPPTVTAPPTKPKSSLTAAATITTSSKSPPPSPTSAPPL